MGLSPDASRDIRTLAERIEERITGTGGGKDLLARWTADGDLGSSSITDSAGVVTIDAILELLGKLTLKNDESICWKNAAGVVTELLRLEPDDDFHIYDDAIIIDAGTGRIGLGGNPNHALDVRGAGVRRIRVFSSDASTVAYRWDTGTRVWDARLTSVSLQFRDVTGAQNVLTLGSDGDAGFIGDVELENNQRIAIRDALGTLRNVLTIDSVLDFLFINKDADIPVVSIRIKSDGSFVIADSADVSLMSVDGADGHVVMEGTVSALRWHRVTDTQRDEIPNPQRGHVVYDTNTQSFQGYFSTSDTQGTGVWGPIAEFPSFAFGSRLTATTTTITTINVAVQVAGAMTASGSELLWTLDTTGSVSKWTYTGPNRILPIALAFELSAQKAGGGTPETFSLSIRVNNVDVGLPAIFSGRQNEPAQVRALAYVALATSDVVTFFVKNTVGTSNVIVNDQAFAAKV